MYKKAAEVKFEGLSRGMSAGIEVTHKICQATRLSRPEGHTEPLHM